MKTLRLALLMALFGAGAAASDVVVLRGGARIDLKGPPVRQGNTVLLTRPDGTLLSVAYSEIDLKATAAAKAARPAAAPLDAAAKPLPETPAEAARAAHEGPRARVRLTDADVGHYLVDVSGQPAEEGNQDKGEGGGGRVDVVDYAQQKSGDNLIVRGTLRNLGSTPALNTRLNVTAVDEKGQTIGSAGASVSNGTLEAGRTVNFSVSIPVGTKTVGVLRFAPQWISPAPPSTEAASSGAYPALPGSGAPAGAKAPAPAPTPYGRGLLYAAPAPSASMSPPADGKSGYIPGAAAPDNQPKTPQ